MTGQPEEQQDERHEHDSDRAAEVGLKQYQPDHGCHEPQPGKEPVNEAAELVLHREERARVADRRLDLEPVADDAGIAQQAGAGGGAPRASKTLAALALNVALAEMLGRWGIKPVLAAGLGPGGWIVVQGAASGIDSISISFFL